MDDKPRRSLLDEIRASRERGEPEFLSSREGRRRFSVAALLERIVTAFVEEHGRDSAALIAAKTEADKIKLVLAVADYIIAVESITISPEDKAGIVEQAYSELFTYGPLDAYFTDEGVTTIALDGPDKASIRYGHGELTPVGVLFEDRFHLEKVIRRLLVDSGADLIPEMPLIETGLRVNERRMCVNVAAPPATIELTADIRLHPTEPPSLDSMVAVGVMPAQAAAFLQALARSEHGFVIVGDTESGKTTLMGALARLIPQSMIAVERAGELALVEEAQRLTVEWPVGESAGMTLQQQVEKALEQQPSLILLDEVRADEAHAVAPLLLVDNPPRQMWTFRGPADSKRLLSALGMLARRSDPGQGEVLVQALYRRLPFVVTLRRRQGQIRLHSIAEWQFADGAEYPDYAELMAMGWDGLESTGRQPERNI
jgi:pilus assembly protein CpaF